MAEAFFTSTRGCVYVVDSGGGKGFYELRGLLGTVSGLGDYSFITGSDLSVGDIVTPMTTLDRKKILQTFGSDWGRSDISGVLLLGEGGVGGGKNLTDLIDFFERTRVHVSQAPASLSIPGDRAYDVYLHRLTIGTPDPETHQQPFVISTVVAE